MEEAQTTLPECVWMCLSDEFIVSSSCLDKFIVKSKWIFQSHLRPPEVQFLHLIFEGSVTLGQGPGPSRGIGNSNHGQCLWCCAAAIMIMARPLQEFTRFI